MAINAATLWEVQTSGSDTNGGAFVPGLTAANVYISTLSVSNSGGLSTNPLVTSTSYNFLPRDIGHYAYIKKNVASWTPGWYAITGVVGSGAMLCASIGNSTQYFSGVNVSGGVTTSSPTIVNTVAGCATTASPTGGMWSIDYSQSTVIDVNDIVAASTTTFSSAALKGTSSTCKNYVGNTINITSGTGFTLGRYQIVSENGAGVMTVDRSWVATSGTASGKLGGPLANPGFMQSQKVTSNGAFIKAGTYIISSSGVNTSSGCLNDTVGGAAATYGTTIGYNSVRCDSGTPPVLQLASGVRSGVIIRIASSFCSFENITCDGNNAFRGRGFLLFNVRAVTRSCNAYNCTSGGFVGSSGGTAISCVATGCSGVAAFSASILNIAHCEAYNNMIDGFNVSAQSVVKCLSYNNIGAGFVIGVLNITEGCIAYNNTKNGFENTSAHGMYVNCVAENNGGSGFYASLSTLNYFRNCAAYNNTVNYVPLTSQRLENCISGSTSFFVNASGGNFAPNNNISGGLLLQGNGYPTIDPKGTTLMYPNIGLQHQELTANNIASGVWNYSNRTRTG